VAADERFAQVPSLFVRNERACILGSWALKGMQSDVLNTAVAGEGLKFGMAAVGAYNVGGITLYCNPALCSNSREDDSRFDGGVARSVVDIKPPVLLSAGDLVGSFRIGSTLVLAAEVPDHWNFSFACKSGEKLRVGQALGRIDPAFAATAAAK
jgi:phosphatidylserine decarboxylase